MLTKSYSDYQIRELVPEALITLDEQDCFIYVNHIAGEMLNRKPEELLGKHIWTEFPEAVSQPIHEAYLKAIQSNQHVYLEEYNSTHDRWFENHIYQSTGGVSICFSDITERKKTESLHQSNELKYKAFFDNSMDGVILGYPDGAIYAANAAACRIFGRTETEICSLGREGLLDKSDERIKKLLDERKQKGEAEGESTGIKNDGTKFPVGFRTKLFTESNGREHTIVIMRDNSELNTAKDKIKEQHSTLHSLIESISNAVFLLDRNYCYTSFNKAHVVGMKAIYGKEIKLGTCLFDYQTKEDAKAAKPNLDRALAGETFTEESYTGDELHKRLFYEITHHPVKDDGGNIIGVSIEAKDITARKKTEDALNESEALYRSILNASPDDITITDLEGKILMISPSSLPIWGYQHEEEILGRSLSEFVIPEDIARIYENISLFQQGINVNPGLYTGVRKDKSSFPVEVNAAFIRNSNGEPVKIILSIRDITERKRAEQALIESENKYRALVENSPDSIVIYQEGKVVFVNNETVRLMAAENKAQLIGKSVLDFVHPDYRMFVTERMKKAAIEGKILPLAEEKFITLTGVEIDVEVKALPIKHENGTAVQVFIRNVTERKKTEEALRSAHQSYFDIFNSSSEAIYIQDETGTFISVNKGAEKMYGYSREELVGQTPASVAAPGLNNLEEVQQMMQSVTETGIAARFDFWGIRKNGEVFPKEVIVNRGTYFEKSVLIATARDITERKIAEDIIRTSEERYRSIITASPDGVTITDLEGRMLMVSPVSLRMLGYEKEEELIGQLITDFLFPDDRQEAANNIALMFQGVMTGLGEYRAVRKDGTVFYMEVNGEFIRDGEAEPLQMVFIIRDISLRKLAEEQLKESEHFLNETQRVSKIGSYKLDITEGKWEASAELKTIFGIPDKSQQTFEEWISVVHPDEQKMMQNYFSKEVLGKKQRFDKVYKIINQKNGNVCWVHGIGDLEFDQNGIPVKMMGTIQDITEKKEAEEILHSKEKLYRALIENGNDGVVILNAWGVFKYIAPSIKGVLGYDEEELLNTSLLDITHPDDYDKSVEIYKEVLASQGLYTPILFHG